MMKKTLISLLVIVLIIPCLTLLSACSSDNANLMHLSPVGNHKLNTEFNQNMYTYMISVTYQPSQSVTVTVNATPVRGASIDDDSVLSVTVNKDKLIDNIIINVTAADGRTAKTYTVTVSMDEPSNNATLSAIDTYGRTLEPAFSSSRETYTITVPYQSSGLVSVAVQPTRASAAAKFDSGNVTQVNVSSLNTSATITIKVIAQNGTTTKTYTITVKMQTASTDANLVGLKVSQSVLTPSFSPSRYEYDVYNIPFASTGNQTVTATPTLPTGAIEGAGTVKSVSLDANKLNATITIVVIAPDGKATKTYTINVHMNKDEDNKLKTLSLSAFHTTTNQGVEGVLSPANFTPNVTDYTFQVPRFTAGGVKVTANFTLPSTAKLADAGNTLEVTVNRNTTGGPTSTISITVISQSGTPRTYTVIVVMQPKNDDCELVDLVIENAVLNETFDPSSTSYTASVPYQNAGTITVRAHPQLPKDATEAAGTVKSLVLSKDNREGVLSIVVRALNGITMQYTITVRMESDSTNAYLTSLTLLGADSYHSPYPFDRNTYVYALHTTFDTPIQADYQLPSGAKIDGNSVLEVSVSASEPHAQLKIIVVASDNVTRTEYIIDVYFVS